MSDDRVVVPIEPAAAALRERFEQEYKDAMRSHNSLAVSTLRLLRAAVQETLVARTDPKRKDFRQPLAESDIVGIIEKQIKQRDEAADAFQKAGRAAQAETERAEGEFLRRYLPQKMERAEIEAAVNRLVAELGPDFRKVMPAAARELKGKADGRLIQEVVRQATGG